MHAGDAAPFFSVYHHVDDVRALEGGRGWGCAAVQGLMEPENGLSEKNDVMEGAWRGSPRLVILLQGLEELGEVGQERLLRRQDLLEVGDV